MRKEEKEGCKRKEESRSERRVRVSVGGDVMEKVDEVKNLIQFDNGRRGSTSDTRFGEISAS